MGIKGVCKFFAHRLFEAFIAVLLILLIPHLPPYSNFSEPYSVTPAKQFKGKLALNDKLNDVEIWHKGDLIGPEAFADYNGELYTSLLGGDIVKLTGNHITPIVKTGKPCAGHYEERVCGRPLGMQFDKNGILYVADAYYGIFKVDVKTGEKTLLVSVEKDINGKKPKLPNSIALASNGDIYWTDSSSEFLLEDGIFVMLADPSGRLIHYDAKTKQNKVLLDKLHFANGVVLSENEEFVVVAETARNRLHRYHLKGPKKGTHDIFIDGLPGLPDNLKSDGKGGFFVPLIIGVDSDHPGISQMIGPFPLVRKLVARILGLTQLGFETINRVYPCEFAQRAVHFIGHFSSISPVFTPARVTILHVSKSGEILDSLHGINKKLSSISEAHIFKDVLYLGSPFNDYIAKVPLLKIGWQHLSVAHQPKPKPPLSTTTTPPPTTTPPTTTTTPRPTTTTKPPPTTTPPTTTTTRPPTTTTTPPPTTTTRPTTPPPTSTTTTRPITTTTPPPPTTIPRSTTTPPPTTTTTTRPMTTTSHPTVAPKTSIPSPSQQADSSASKQPTQGSRSQQTQHQAPQPQQTPPIKQQVPPQKGSSQTVQDQTKSVPVKNQQKVKNEL